MSSKLRHRLSALLLSLPRAMATEADSAARRLLLQHVFGLLRLLHVSLAPPHAPPAPSAHCLDSVSGAAPL